jgi:Fic-DOC domain mobile mystery protein B
VDWRIPDWSAGRLAYHDAVTVDRKVTASRHSRRPAGTLNPDFTIMLHKQMFGDVWKWAGTYRTTARNLGIDAYRIGTEVAQLVGDARYWLENKTYQPDETAVRFHHRLVAIHPFPNGNGRHSRLMADFLIERFGGTSLSWRGGSLTDTGELRRQYVDALRAADNHDIGPLLSFARS